MVIRVVIQGGCYITRTTYNAQTQREAVTSLSNYHLELIDKYLMSTYRTTHGQMLGIKHCGFVYDFDRSRSSLSKTYKADVL